MVESTCTSARADRDLRATIDEEEVTETFAEARRLPALLAVEDVDTTTLAAAARAFDVRPFADVTIAMLAEAEQLCVWAERTSVGDVARTMLAKADRDDVFDRPAPVVKTTLDEHWIEA